MSVNSNTKHVAKTSFIPSVFLLKHWFLIRDFVIVLLFQLLQDESVSTPPKLLLEELGNSVLWAACHINVHVCVIYLCFLESDEYWATFEKGKNLGQIIHLCVIKSNSMILITTVLGSLSPVSVCQQYLSPASCKSGFVLVSGEPTFTKSDTLALCWATQPAQKPMLRIHHSMSNNMTSIFQKVCLCVCFGRRRQWWCWVVVVVVGG